MSAGLIAGVTLAASVRAARAGQSIYTIAATRSCLMSLPSTVGGLPPARPPVPAALFVYVLAHDDEHVCRRDDSGGGSNHMGEQRLTTDLMQHFRMARLQPRAFARGHDYDGSLRSG